MIQNMPRRVSNNLRLAQEKLAHSDRGDRAGGSAEREEKKETTCLKLTYKKVRFS